jgi:hypothetical protein
MDQSKDGIDDVDRRSAQAMVATFMQMARSAEMARQLQKMRARSLERRLQEIDDPGEVKRLQRQLEAQQNQAAILESAVERFASRASEMVELARQGLTEDELRAMGIGNQAPGGEPEPEAEPVAEPSVDDGGDHGGSAPEDG